jgi:uncharacterized protein YecE (DUF72 family)
MSGVQIRVGVGGWTYEPWRETFYPKGLPRSRELEHASRQLTAIEVNGTFYRTQTPATFARWREETPEGFVLSLKAPRYAVNRKVLAEAGPSIERFIGSGVSALGDRLGPILWQLAPTKRFEPDDLERFLGLFPKGYRHALEVRHESFVCEEYLALARRYGVATVYTDSEDYPSIPEITGDFVYARLMRAQAELDTGYAPQALAEWAERARRWARGERGGRPREVFVFFINGAKERAPGAARGLLRALA